MAISTLRSVGMNVTVNQKSGCRQRDKVVEGLKPTMAEIVVVSNAARRRVGQENVDSRPAPSHPALTQQSMNAASHLFLGVLIWTRPVTVGPPEPGYPDSRDLRDLQVDVDAPTRSQSLLCIVIARHIKERFCQNRHEILQVVGGKVTTGDDDIGSKLGEKAAIGAFTLLV
jgi:hypothetical protein